MMGMSEKLSPFDFVNAISSSKEQLFDDPDVQESWYVPFLANRALSYHLDSIMYANDMNRYPQLDRKLQFDYHLNSIRPRKRYGKWAKPFDSDDLKLVQRAFGQKATVAAQTLALLSEADLKVIRDRYDEGGVGDKRTR
jgi:hypothetical protein